MFQVDEDFNFNSRVGIVPFFLEEETIFFKIFANSFLMDLYEISEVIGSHQKSGWGIVHNGGNIGMFKDIITNLISFSGGFIFIDQTGLSPKMREGLARKATDQIIMAIFFALIF